MVTTTTSAVLESYLADIGVSGRVRYIYPIYRLTLSGTGRGRLIVELPNMGREPGLIEYIRQMFQPRLPKWQHETTFFSPSELRQIQEMIQHG